MGIERDIEKCVKAVDRIGTSKREAREKGLKQIHSHKTKSEVLKIGKQFGRYVKENFGINKLHQVDETHYRAFLDSKANTTLDYRRSIETHLRLIQEGLNQRAEQFGKEKAVFTSEKRLISSRGRLEGVSDRSYSQTQINALKGVLRPSVARSVVLMEKLGLRVSESVGLRVEHIQDGYIRIENDSVTKGGRDRLIPIPENFREELNRLCAGKGAEERLVPLATGTVQNELKRACKVTGIESKGTHAFRHSYARGRVDQLMNQEEKSMFQQCMERYSEGKSFDYGVHNRKVYESVKGKMDKIHTELGHGKNRFDLAIRYMR